MTNQILYQVAWLTAVTDTIALIMIPTPFSRAFVTPMLPPTTKDSGVAMLSAPPCLTRLVVDKTGAMTRMK